MSGWSTACPDWGERLQAGRSLIPDLPLDDAAAARAVAIFNRLRLPDVPNRPALADAAGAWQRDLVGALFGSRLRDFEHDGDLVIVDDMEAAFTQVAALCAEVEQSGLLAQVGLDPMGVGAIVDALAEVDIAGNDRIVGVPQGWTLNGAIKTTEIKLASGALLHAQQRIMDWAVGNAKAEPKGNAITITKQAAGTGKIDPVMALFDAVVLMSRNPEAEPVLDNLAMVA